VTINTRINRRLDSVQEANKSTSVVAEDKNFIKLWGLFRRTLMFVEYVSSVINAYALII
jgi:hypothetical protein